MNQATNLDCLSVNVEWPHSPRMFVLRAKATARWGRAILQTPNGNAKRIA
jgi:hypothetical protein